MVKSEQVKKGSKISKIFEGAQFQEQSITRKGLYAMIVLSNPNKYTPEEIEQANENIIKFEEYNKKVTDLLLP